ncbi:ribonuclease E [Glaciihabitans tibetensis]|uniref:Ribonuclease E n=1 Tax=Glaciihabitans tibetensis TaxID=1266600 RepID=A0A2T0VJ56_9MICO|nr:Rne/Rng family ribonuclease [Glaciihabitans tibetensis]PRY70135.1 ribonuclease E [Glaciihabitans tibetensis]
MVNTNNNNEAPKKRSRLFGGRKTVQASVPPPAAAEPERTEIPEPDRSEALSTADESSATAPPARRAAPTKAPAVDEFKESDMDDAPIGHAPMTVPEIDHSARRTPPRPTTSLLFQAPDLPPLAPLAPRTSDRRDDAGRDDDRREPNRRDSNRRTDDRRDVNRRDDDRRDVNRRDDDRRDVNRRDDDRRDANRRDDDRREQAPDDVDRADDQQDDDTPNVRRRSRRRPGEEPRAGDTDPNTVIKVRQPRQQPQPELITEPQRIKGSTRLEAKKQRRRDGRDAGRRRPVITEAEFLARRESVDRMMIVRSKFDRTQIAVLEDGVLVEHYVAKAAEASLIGNVYLGRVQNVLPSMEAAFVDIGRGRNAVLYSGEVDWDAAAADSDSKNQPRRIELALKPGDRVLVQVTKDPIGHKGARLTSQVSLPGRYLVYVPNGSMNGISRKLPDTERARLKKILKEVLPENVGVIVRTASEGATEEQLTLDVNRLTSQWAEISRLVETSQAPVLLHSEPDLLVKIVRDVFNEDFQKLVIAGPEAQSTIEAYLRSVAPDLLERVETYEGDTDSFDAYRVTEQIEKALDRKVWLPSGGSLVIDRTEAMTVVDVNTGKFVGSGGNLEETVTKNNLEAAEEIVRQLRLRDIGGIIVVDFIDMVLETNRDLVLRRLVECLSRDRTKHQVAEVTSLGLIQMTRKKLGLGLIESFSEPCEHCAGRGIIIHHDPTTQHRQTPQQQPEGNGRGRRGNKGQSGAPTAPRGNSSAPNSNGSATVPAGQSAPVKHAITDDVRNALARVAASTVHTDAPSAEGAVLDSHEKVDAASAATPEAQAPASTDGASGIEAAVTPEASDGAESTEAADAGKAPTRASRGGRQERGNRQANGERQSNGERQGNGERGGRNADRAGGRQSAADRSNARKISAEEINAQHTVASEPTVEAPAAPIVGEGAEADSVAIFDLPVTKAQRAPRRISTHDAEQILDSVLEALPEPKQPGQGRSRVSRRASSAGAGIITTEVKE